MNMENIPKEFIVVTINRSNILIKYTEGDGWEKFYWDSCADNWDYSDNISEESVINLYNEKYVYVLKEN